MKLIKTHNAKTVKVNYHGIDLEIPIDKPCVATDFNGEVFAYSHKPVLKINDVWAHVEGPLICDKGEGMMEFKIFLTSAFICLGSLGLSLFLVPLPNMKTLENILTSISIASLITMVASMVLLVWSN